MRILYPLLRKQLALIATVATRGVALSSAPGNSVRATCKTAAFAHQSSGRIRAARLGVMSSSRIHDDYDDMDFNGCSHDHPDLTVLDSDDLLDYYRETKRILLGSGSSNRNNSGVAFSLHRLEQRHRKSMMRCVLNSNHVNRKISKQDFEQRLRLVDRKQKWKWTHQLLFGEDDSKTGNRFRGGDQHWWESGIIEPDQAPGLVEGILQYQEYWHSEMVPVDRAFFRKPTDDPKKLLTRLARGRYYRGNFRALLEDVVTFGSSSGENRSDTDEHLIVLYDKIANEKKSSSNCDEARQLELLRLLVDELEEEAGAAATDNCESRENDHNQSLPPVGVVSKEQLYLLRSICDLDVFFNSPPGDVSDWSIPLGKRGERDMTKYLVREKQKSPSSSSLRIFAPVWIRPKGKNRRFPRPKCRYVVEIPSTIPTDDGITTEFDAVVARVIESDNTTGKNSNSTDSRPIMVIREVWEAKATLAPPQLLDVLEKKANSLQKILFHENSCVLNISDLVFGDEANGTSVVDSQSDNGIEDGVSFVVSPHFGTKNLTPGNGIQNESMAKSPLVYRLAIESTNRNSCDESSGQQNLQSFPQIGVFASRMLEPKAAVRRIQTIVYEGMLETDLETVKGILRANHFDVGGLGVDPLEQNHSVLRCNQLLRDRSVEIVERILRRIEDLRPIAVVGTLLPNF